jgi:CO dehydrogenase maturation factor
VKIALTGRGGVGKTTLTSLLACAFAQQDRAVLAIDADPAPSLGPALGFPEEILRELRPIAEMRELIAERTGTKPGQYGSYFQLNPRVDDLPDRFSATHRGIRLLQLGSVEKRGGSGCFCAESTLLKALVRHILFDRDEVVLLDFYAGVEHLGRATADSVDAMLIVVEPTPRSMATAAQIRDLARDIHLDRLFLVGSKTEGEADAAFIAAHSPGLPLLGCLPFDPQVRQADRAGLPAYDLSPTLAVETWSILATLQQALESERTSRQAEPAAG